MIRNNATNQYNTSKPTAKGQSPQQQEDPCTKIEQSKTVVDPLEAHVDAVINDESFKRGLQEQITQAVKLNITNIMTQSQRLK
jgi:hypothetical protein